MNTKLFHSSFLACVGVSGFLLAGCATTPPPKPAPPPAVQGFTFGYNVQGGVTTDVMSNTDKTWFTLPKGVQLQQAEGDGTPYPITHQGAYWVADGVASRWRLYTSAGPVWASAPGTVGVMLAADHQVQQDKPVYKQVTETITVPYVTGSHKLGPTALVKLDALAGHLAHAHKIDKVIVSGQTSAGGSVAANARVGAARAKTVVKWLQTHGIAPIKNLGWTQSVASKQATVAVLYKVRKYPAKPQFTPSSSLVEPDTAHALRPRGAGSAPGAQPAPVQGSSHSNGGKQAPGNKHSPSTLNASAHGAYRLTLVPGDLLSRQLQEFFRKAGWSLVWKGQKDYVVGQPGHYKGTSLKALLANVAQDYHLRVHLYQADHTVAVESEAK